MNVKTCCLVLWSNFRDHIPCGGGHRGCLHQYQARSALQPPGQPDGRGCLSVTASGIWRANWFEAGPIDRSRGPQSPTTNWTALEACKHAIKNGILLPKLFWPTVRKNCSSDWEKLLKFEAEGWEFAKLLRSLEQFIQTVQWKVRTMFGNRMFF